MRRSRTVLFAALAVCLSMICTFPSGEAVRTRGEVGGYFEGERIYMSEKALSGGMGSGDLDLDGEVEVTFCDFDGNVMMLDPQEDGSYKSIMLWQEEGPQGTDKGLFDLIVTDIDASREGLEILTAGYSGKIYMIYRDAGTWTSEVLFLSDFRVTDLEIGDVDPSMGDEIIFGSWINNQDDPDRFLRFIKRTGTDAWEQVEIPVLDTIKAIEVADADPSIQGTEIWATTSGWNDEGGTMSSLLEIYKVGSAWKYKEVFEDPENLITNVMAGDIWSVHPGNEMILTGLSGWCWLAWESGGSIQTKALFQAKTATGSSSGLEGLTIGDFNPLHEGEEGMVTGYYNEVTQIIESDGNVVGDLAWSTEADYLKLELSGVEWGDIDPDSPGNEVLVASLQGWIELLRLEEDGLQLEAPDGTFEVVEGEEEKVLLTIIPKGLVSGPVRMTVDGVDELYFDYPKALEVKDHEPLEVQLRIGTKGSVSGRTVDITVSAVVGEFEAEETLQLKLVPAGGGISIQFEPSHGVIYDQMGSSLRSRITIVGAEKYDYLDMSVPEVEGLTIGINTPIVPGSEEYITILPNRNVTPGQRTIMVTASSSGIPLAQGALTIDVVPISELIYGRLIDLGNGRYQALVIFNGTQTVKLVTMEIWFLAEKLHHFSGDLAPGINTNVTFQIPEGKEGLVIVIVKDVAGGEISVFEIGRVKGPPKEDGTPGDWVVFGFIFLVVLVTIVAVVLFYLSKRPGIEDESLQSIGGPRRYNIPNTNRRERLPTPQRRMGPPPPRSAPYGRPGPRTAPSPFGVKRDRV